MPQSHPNPLIVSTATYEALPAHHFLRRPRNILSDPPVALTSEVERLTDARKLLLGYKIPSSQHYDPKGYLTGAFLRFRYLPPKSRADSILMLPAASDEVVKDFGLTAGPLSYYFRRFLDRASRTYPCVWVHGLPITDFFIPPPRRKGRSTKNKTAFRYLVSRKPPPEQ
ncbi:hypothetical protein EVAR_27669_1 [Eumeta japonica]|uniref:Uncharacterized protein n=1 Tax=Eumeta variegata TaxID=151549 RepID=A0A4C1V1W7_EUMVA|nr:hypothetical protein EVAR_27669_1 [Eumeta japonica]